MLGNACAAWATGFGLTVSKGIAPRSDGTLQLYLRPETWLSDDALYPGRIVLAPDAEPGERLGDRLLMPSALREGG